MSLVFRCSLVKFQTKCTGMSCLIYFGLPVGPAKWKPGEASSGRGVGQAIETFVVTTRNPHLRDTATRVAMGISSSGRGGGMSSYDRV